MIFLSPSEKSPNRNQTTRHKLKSSPIIMDRKLGQTDSGLSCWKPISSSSDFLVPMGCNALRISFAYRLWLMTVCAVTVCCYADQMPVKTMAQILGVATYFTDPHPLPYGWQSCLENKKTLKHVA